MSYADDEMIAAEDAVTNALSAKTAEELTQVMRVLDQAGQTPTLAALPDFSTVGAYWFDANATKKLARDAAKQFATRRFNPPRDLPSALDEGQLTRAEWGMMNVGHPVVVAALAEAEDSERMSRKYGAAYPYRCNECLANGKREVFPWAGALFVHLLTCPHFAADVNGGV